MSEPAVTEIRAELDRIVASPLFLNSPRIAAFLRFIVERAIAGQSAKEYEIGVEVFRKLPTFDPRLDSIVRVEARRLRQKLKAYYEQERATSSIVIDLQEGGYSPAFLRPLASTSPTVVDPESQPTDIAIAVLPCTALTAGPDTRRFCQMLTEDLIHSCAGLLNVRVAPSRSTARFAERKHTIQQVGEELNVTLVLETTARKTRNTVWVRAQLIGTQRGFILQSRTYVERASGPTETSMEVARRVVADLAASMVGRKHGAG